MSYKIYCKIDGKLRLYVVSNAGSHKEAILEVKEALVAEGDCLTNKAVLALIEGGSNA